MFIMNTCMYTWYRNTKIYVFPYVYMYIYIYMYMYAYIYIYIDIDIYMDKVTRVQVLGAYNTLSGCPSVNTEVL